MKEDRVLSIICFAGAFIFFIFSFGIKASSATASLGPRFWPSVLSLLIMTLSIVIFVKSYKFKSSEDSEKVTAEPHEDKPLYPKRLWISFGLLCTYVLLIPYIGFIISTLLFITTNMYIAGYKQLKKLMPLSMVVIVVIVTVFPRLLAIPLPRGIGIFKVISRIFY